MLNRRSLGPIFVVILVLLTSLSSPSSAFAGVSGNESGGQAADSGEGSETTGGVGSGESDPVGATGPVCWSESATPPGSPIDNVDPGLRWFGTIVCEDGSRDGPRWHHSVSIPIGGPSGPTPDQVRTWAWELTQSFELQPISIGMAPRVNPDWGHRRTYIGVPVWLWVDSPTNVTWGPFERTMDFRTVSYRFDAQVDRIVWDLGDGTSVTCGLGQAYDTTMGVVDSPGCGDRYEHTSAGQPGGKYPVTATSYWNVTWSGAGQSGSFDLEFTSSTEVEVLELQSVNVSGPPGPNGG